MNMTLDEKKKLIKLQQGELDAVLMYQRLAVLSKNQKHKEVLLKIAADEGKHSAIAKKYTGENLAQGTKLASIIGFIAKLIGLNLTFKLLAKAEFKAKDMLSPLTEKFPEIHEVIKDEEEHGRLLTSLVK